MPFRSDRYDLALAAALSALPPGYYAPGRALAVTPFLDPEVRLPAVVRRLVWFVDHWSPNAEQPPGLVEIEIPHGRFLYVLSVGRSPVDYAGYTFVREEPAQPAPEPVRARAK